MIAPTLSTQAEAPKQVFAVAEAPDEMIAAIRIRWTDVASGLAQLVARALDCLGYDEVDVLGISWGGALAQQHAHQYPTRCRRLVLVSTGTGAVMVPGRPSVLWMLASRRRYADPAYMASVAPHLYGGRLRAQPELAVAYAQSAWSGGARGYYAQLFAGAGWTSIHWLWRLHQPTLILSGRDDPIVPWINGWDYGPAHP